MARPLLSLRNRRFKRIEKYCYLLTNKSRATGTFHHVSFLAWYGQKGWKICFIKTQITPQTQTVHVYRIECSRGARAIS